jgi:hypothetical protein
MAKVLFLFFLLNSIENGLLAQDSLEKRSNLTWCFFIDAYYSYDFAKPSNHEKALFLYNYNRHNEVNINLLLASLSYNDSAKRSNIGLMAGTYPQYNLAAEPELLRHIYEANVGIKLTKSKQLWLDAGILPSHLGFETIISKDCWTLTRSLLAENSPYYEAGVRASYKTSNQKWYIAAQFLNGWQRTKRVNANNTPSFGTQLTFTPTDRFSINSSAFVGNDKPDSIRKWRYFHNLYSIWQFTENLGIIWGLDVGLEQKQKGSSKVNRWYSPVLIVRYHKRNWSIAGRLEYYNDKHGVIVPLVNSNPFQMQGYSLNIDRLLRKGIVWRVEGRVFSNPTNYFVSQNQVPSRSNASIVTSLSFDFH